MTDTSIAFTLPTDLLKASHLSFDERRAQLCEQGRVLLSAFREQLMKKHRAGASGTEVVGDYTRLIDSLIADLFKAITLDLDPAVVANVTLVATGGYGRYELNPRSDIDIMFLGTPEVASTLKIISERLLYLLWDMALDVGHSVRTLKDCLEVADQDITVRTALLDARYLVGSQTLFAEFEKTVMKELLGRNSQKFIIEKLEEQTVRRRKFGSTVYLLEPNIKEGEGGLRDLHTALWIARVKYRASSLQDLVRKGALSEQEAAAFRQAIDALWRVRNELHFLSPRKNEQINFDQQEKIAHFLGYVDTRKAPAVELFMQDYYFQATQIEHLASTLIARATESDSNTPRFFSALRRRQVEGHFYILRGELRLDKPNLFETEPEQMMRAFLLAHHHRVPLSIAVKGQIRANLKLINDAARRSKTMAESFLEILRTMRGDSTVLRDMHHLQFLNAFIPEFRRIYCKVQHDAYHIYTVDVHSIIAVEEIAKLRDGTYAERKPLLTKLAGDVGKGETLMLAALFHDIGKGEGKDHANKGADLIPTIARRLGLKREDSQRLEFLIRRHLDMAHISQRRDMHDDKLIDQFASSMGMTENLRMLYLLAFADIKAVGPDVWTEWKGFLLQELYEKAYQVLERGNFRFDTRSERLRERKRKVIDALSEEFGERRLRAALKTMSNRYLLSHRSSEIITHVRLALERGEETLALLVEHDKKGEYTQIILSTLDMSGLFSIITGVMAANGINILGAQIYTRSDGEALDILQVRRSTGGIIDDPKKWNKVRNDLNAVLEGRKRIDALFKRSSSLMPEKPRPRQADRVEVVNDVSDQYTVVDVYTTDKVGLLYDITRTLSSLGLYIGVAKISTKVDQVADTFYLQDIFGQKVTQPDKLDELRNRLLESLADSKES